MCCTAASARGPARRMSPMWLTSKMPTPVHTAMCSTMMPPPTDAGYSPGMSQPLNSTIFAPIWRWTAFSAVFRTVGAVASTADKLNLNRRRDDVTDYRNTCFFGGSNREMTGDQLDSCSDFDPALLCLRRTVHVSITDAKTETTNPRAAQPMMRK